MPCADGRWNHQRQPDAYLPESFAQPHEHHRTAVCSQCHSHANLVRPLFHALGCHTIETHGSQRQPDGPKQPRQACDHVLLRKIGMNNFGVGPNAIYTCLFTFDDNDFYACLVRTDGVIADHTIKTCRVDQFWNEIKTRFRHEEIIENSAQGCAGIGILHAS
jgi:hypothetical protein